ncbi:hypothetical protein BD309DRAFT_1016858 [Dichomitus squalens]|uniref:Uncharacterized protein n=1 Tax=Dichomitus squalens TaxID=114155 RepID=A0A4Q9NY13_9APHY|nr:hypothetical protein BD309DRAFT_1016858 [Dichomitus squalens]TBU60493.1 hypothetical protein BD310DRAFT_957562 [Dichomitus squalens]
MPASPRNPGQYAEHSPTGEYVQKQSIPKSVARAIPKHDIVNTMMVWGLEGMSGKRRFRTPQMEQANARRRLQRALKKARAAYPPLTTLPLPVTTKAQAVHRPAMVDASEAERDTRKETLPAYTVLAPTSAEISWDVLPNESAVSTTAVGLQPDSAAPSDSGHRSRRAATTQPTQGRQLREQKPYSRVGGHVGAQGYAATWYAIPEDTPAFLPAPREECPPLDIFGDAPFAGAGYADHHFANVINGGIVPPSPASQPDVPAVGVHEPLVNWHRVPIPTTYGSILDATRGRSTGLASVSHPALVLPGRLSEQGYNPEDEPFDLEALERSLANSTESTSSDALVNPYDARGYVVHARTVGALPAHYTGVRSIAVGPLSGVPEAIWQADAGAHNTAAGKPTLNAVLDASIVEANVSTSMGIPSIDLFAIPMDDDPTFDGCFDECEPLWLPEAKASGSHAPIAEWSDIVHFTTSSAHYPQSQAANPCIGSAAGAR